LITLVGVGVALTFIFSGDRILDRVARRGSLARAGRRVGDLAARWLLYDGLVLVAVALFSDYPIERPLLALTFAQPGGPRARPAAAQARRRRAAGIHGRRLPARLFGPARTDARGRDARACGSPLRSLSARASSRAKTSKNSHHLPRNRLRCLRQQASSRISSSRRPSRWSRAAGEQKPGTEAGTKQPPAAAATADANWGAGPLNPDPGGKVISVELYTDGTGNYFQARRGTTPSPATLSATRSRLACTTFISWRIRTPARVPILKRRADFLQLPGQTWDLAVKMPAGSYFFQCDPHAALGMKGPAHRRVKRAMGGWAMGGGHRVKR
jgi:hypothetical protein